MLPHYIDVLDDQWTVLWWKPKEGMWQNWEFINCSKSYIDSGLCTINYVLLF